MIFIIQTGKSGVFVINTFHTDVSIKRGTELGRFQVCKTVEVINNQEHKCDEDKQTAQVFSLQESLQSEKDIKQRLVPTSRPDLEKEQVNLLLLHKAAVALTGDALGKQLYCNTGSNSSQEHNPFTFPHRLCGATVARPAHNREVPDSILGQSGKIWAVFPITPRPCSPSSE